MRRRQRAAEGTAFSAEASDADPAASDGAGAQVRPGSTRSATEVLLFAPNIVDYARMLLLLCAFAFVPPSRVLLFSFLYLLNFALDAVDGMLARRLNQTSLFGSFLDVATDNTLRALMWGRALSGHCLGSLIPCLEWVVFVATHSASLTPLPSPPYSSPAPPSSTCAQGAAPLGMPMDPNLLTGHPQGTTAELAGARADRKEREGKTTGTLQAEGDWKGSIERGVPPWWVAAVMANGFKNPAGAIAIAGLHFLPLWIWLQRTPTFSPTAPASVLWGLASPNDVHWALSHWLVGLLLIFGRSICLFVEGWVLVQHLSRLLRIDTKQS